MNDNGNTAAPGAVAAAPAQSLILGENALLAEREGELRRLARGAA